jgi:hypothetical protein
MLEATVLNKTAGFFSTFSKLEEDNSVAAGMKVGKLVDDSNFFLIMEVAIEFEFRRDIIGLFCVVFTTSGVKAQDAVESMGVVRVVKVNPGMFVVVRTLSSDTTVEDGVLILSGIKVEPIVGTCLNFEVLNSDDCTGLMTDLFTKGGQSLIIFVFESNEILFLFMLLFEFVNLVTTDGGGDFCVGTSAGIRRAPCSLFPLQTMY